MQMLQNLNVQKNHLDSLLNMQILTSSQDVLVYPFCSKHGTVTDHILKGKKKEKKTRKSQLVSKYKMNMSLDQK